MPQMFLLLHVWDIESESWTLWQNFCCFGDNCGQAIFLILGPSFYLTIPLYKGPYWGWCVILYILPQPARIDW